MSSYIPTSSFLDIGDLEEIVAIMGQSGSPVVIEDHEYRFESLSELRERRGPKPSRLSIGIDGLVFAVRMNRRRSELRAYGRELKIWPLFFAIKDLLESRERERVNLLFHFLPFLPILIALPLLGLIRPSPYLTWIIMIPAAVLALIAKYFELGFKDGMFVAVSLHRGYDQKSFWDRNRDKIWMLIIGAVVGAVLSLIVGWAKDS